MNWIFKCFFLMALFFDDPEDLKKDTINSYLQNKK